MTNLKQSLNKMKERIVAASFFWSLSTAFSLRKVNKMKIGCLILVHAGNNNIQINPHQFDLAHST